MPDLCSKPVDIPPEPPKYEKGVKYLKKIIFGITLVFLLSINVWAADSNSGKVSVQVLAKTDSSWNGDKLPAYPTGKPQITILRIKIPAGAKLPWHEHPVINAGILLRGELTVVTDDGQRLHLKAGDSIVEVVNKWHYGMNEGSKPAEIIVFYAGSPGCPVTVKE